VDSHDPWLDSVTDNDIQKAKEAHAKRQERVTKAQESKPLGRIRLMKELIGILQPEETTLQALRRLGSTKKHLPHKKKPEAKGPELV